MKNRDRLAQINTFDLLCKVNGEIDRAQTRAIEEPESFISTCIIDAITEDYEVCPRATGEINMEGYVTICQACIARWLNAEYNGRW